MNEQMNPYLRGMEPQEDEIEIAQILLTLWNHKSWIIFCTAFITIIGILYAVSATPVYYSQATIALKESGKGSSAASIFSQLGGVGDAFAAELGVGNTSLPKTEIILKSEDLADSVIEKNNLMPILFRNSWDSEHDSWKTKIPKKVPTLRRGAEVLSKNLLQVTTDEKKGIIRVGVRLYDPLLAEKIVEYYLMELNSKIRLNVMNDADSNRSYLERQLNNTSDPILIEKIQNLIAEEIGKTMLMSSSAFEILEKPTIPLERYSPNRMQIVMTSFIVGLILSALGIYARKGIGRFRTTMARNNISSSKDG